MKILVVGAGFSGAVVARSLAEHDIDVTVIDKRDHIGGNAFDYIDPFGIRVHKYGPHLFHTSNDAVVHWLSRFTEWVPYKHKVKALLKDGRLVTLPVNIETIEAVGAEHVVDTFFRPYSKKMWGVDLELIDKTVMDRIPVRQDRNEYYFPNDKFQALPKNGYTGLFINILDHPKINVILNREFNGFDREEYFHIFNSMAIDEFFGYSLGELPYRSVKFHNYTIPIPRIFPVATVNFTHDDPYTRVTEWKNLPNHGGSSSHTTLTIEEPCSYLDNRKERYYPVRDAASKNRDLYRRYAELVPNGMTFMGRCGLYAYLDMHQAVSSALKIAEQFLERNGYE
jgi:UDP-galactopyranose mutase